MNNDNRSDDDEVDRFPTQNRDLDPGPRSSPDRNPDSGPLTWWRLISLAAIVLTLLALPASTAASVAAQVDADAGAIQLAQAIEADEIELSRVLDPGGAGAAMRIDLPPVPVVSSDVGDGPARLLDPIGRPALAGELPARRRPALDDGADPAADNWSAETGTRIVAPAAADSTLQQQDLYEVEVHDDRFEPETITITVGSIVRWTNYGQNLHSSTSEQGLWDWTLVPGARFYLRFLSPGRYDYYCRYHRDAGMVGTVVVVEDQQPGPTATATVPGPSTPPIQPTPPFPTPNPTLPPPPPVPEGDEIVYDWYAEGSTLSDLFAIQSDGTGKRQLTDTADRYEAQPSWAPDGRRVAYTESRGQGDAWRIHVLDTATGADSQLTQSGYNFEPDWRPDGGLLAFTDITRVGDIVTRSSIDLLAPDGTGRRSLIFVGTPGYAMAGPSWSPSGDRIAFAVRSDAGGGELYTVRADNPSQVLRYSRPGYDDIDPAWSPDGRYLAFASGIHRGQPADKTEHAIWLLDRYDLRVGTLARVPGWDLRRPAWSPDGSHIVFHAKFAEGGYALYIVPATGGAVTGPLDYGVEPDWGRGSLLPFPTPQPGATATPVTPPSPPPLPTFPSEPTLTPGAPPTFPPPPEPSATPIGPSPTATIQPAMTDTAIPIPVDVIHLPLLLKGELLGGPSRD